MRLTLRMSWTSCEERYALYRSLCSPVSEQNNTYEHDLSVTATSTRLGKAIQMLISEMHAMLGHKYDELNG